MVSIYVVSLIDIMSSVVKVLRRFIKYLHSDRYESRVYMHALGGRVAWFCYVH